jgi:hypothetical protein
MNHPHAYFTAGAFSIGAGFVHTLAAGTHLEHRTAALLMAVLGASQVGTGIAVMKSSSYFAKYALIATQVIAIGAWLATRTVGIGFINGFDRAESIQTADALCALLAVLALTTIVWNNRFTAVSVTPVLSSVMALVLVVPATYATTTHDHSSHSDTTTATHDHSSNSETTAATWPRPYFPGIGIDIGGVEGVSAEQEARARQLVLDTQKELIRWADYKVAIAEGWTSIGDQATGYEHFINLRYFNDGYQLDATRPESIVYKVYGDTRILVSAMYMAEGEPALDSPLLTDFAGPLFEWHVHTNLCWGMRNGVAGIVGVTDANGACPAGSTVRPIRKPMVHVWIVPHPCGPFAAVEGLAEGQAAVPDSQRVDMCGDHAH